jgi:hypothetical protein
MGSVIKVTPGPDDTKALNGAFALAKAYGKSAIVKLMPGKFKISMIEVKEFSGTFSGSGKGKTIITSLPDLTPDAVVAQNKVPALITFIGGNVSVSDMSVILSEGLSWIGQYEMNVLLFSDYSADFTPARKHIDVNLNNIEVSSVQPFNYTYNAVYGVKFAPDMLAPAGILLVSRSNIDAKVTNSKFSNVSVGVKVWGCKNGNFNFGEAGGNIFTDDNSGLNVQENTGVTVKIIKNEFNIPDNREGIDLNAYEQSFFEFTPSRLGTYEIRYNIFNVNMGGEGFGLYDNWRYDHPENPDWMKMTWDHNTFNALGDKAIMGYLFGLKNAVFSANKIIGDAQGGYLGIWGNWEGNPLKLTENCKFLYNLFLQKGFVIDLKPETKNCLIMGDLRNVTVNNAGVNNSIIPIKNPGSKDSQIISRTD